MNEMRDSNKNQWKTLDKDLNRWAQMEDALAYFNRPKVALSMGALFVLLCAVAAVFLAGGSNSTVIIVTAAAFGGYMALNIGANDVANNMGPAVGANALTMGGALIIAAIFETMGALIAGGDVVSTISGGIVSPEAVSDPNVFIWAMMAALIASSLWLNLATWVGAPVSTTHAIVGGVMGAGVAAAGFGAVNWSTMSQIAMSWVISPMLGGIIAALVLAFIKTRINDAEDKLAAARLWVPVLMGVMAGAFTTYLSVKGLRRIVELSVGNGVLLGLGVGVAVILITRPVIARQSQGMENRKKSLKKLFNLPLIVSAALLSFAHGANDVANAVGPLAAIVHAVKSGGSDAVVTIPLWVMVIGALGISFGLTLFGPKLIHVVGAQITKLNAMRAYCVALSAAVTVIIASWMGLPVSSTHIAVGAIFGVGFYREWDSERRSRRLGIMKGKPLTSEERRRRKLVRRSHILGIGAAWVITVPLTALLSALVFVVLRWISG